MAKAKRAPDWKLNRDAGTPAPVPDRPRPVADDAEAGDTFTRRGIGLRTSLFERAKAIAAENELSVNAVLVYALTTFIERYDAGPGKAELQRRRKPRYTVK